MFYLIIIAYFEKFKNQTEKLKKEFFFNDEGLIDFKALKNPVSKYNQIDLLQSNNKLENNTQSLTKQISDMIDVKECDDKTRKINNFGVGNTPRKGREESLTQQNELLSSEQSPDDVRALLGSSKNNNKVMEKNQEKQDNTKNPTPKNLQNNYNNNDNFDYIDKSRKMDNISDSYITNANDNKITNHFSNILFNINDKEITIKNINNESNQEKEKLTNKKKKEEINNSENNNVDELGIVDIDNNECIVNNNNEKTSCEIKFLNNNNNNDKKEYFYIIIYDVEEVLFPLTTLNTLLELHPKYVQNF